jgi:hypothetical protein
VPTEPTPAAPEEDEQFDSFSPYGEGSQAVVWVARIFWLALGVGLIDLWVYFLLSFLRGVNATKTSGWTYDGCTVTILAAVIMTPASWVQVFQGCYASCCCCKGFRTRVHFALANPILAIGSYVFLFALAENYVVKTVPGPDTREHPLSSLVSTTSTLAMVFFILSWVLWAVLLVLNYLTRFKWWPAEHPEGIPQVEPSSSSVDSLVQFPFIEWITMGTWVLCSLALLMCVCFGWVGWQAVSISLSTYNTNAEGFGVQIAFMAVARLMFGYIEEELLLRAVGFKGDTGCVSYKCWLFAPYVPLISCVVATVAYARCSALTANPAMFPLKLYFVAISMDESTTEGREACAGELWEQNQSLHKATMAFMIMAWIGTALLAVVNLLSGIGIRPKVGVAAEPPKTPPENSGAPPAGQPPVAFQPPAAPPPASQQPAAPPPAGPPPNTGPTPGQPGSAFPSCFASPRGSAPPLPPPKPKASNPVDDLDAPYTPMRLG